MRVLPSVSFPPFCHFDWSGPGPSATLVGNCGSFTRETIGWSRPSRRSIPTSFALMAFAEASPSLTGCELPCATWPCCTGAAKPFVEIAEALGITEAQVFHALSYFFDHCDEILALIAEEEQAHAQFDRT